MARVINVDKNYDIPLTLVLYVFDRLGIMETGIIRCVSFTKEYKEYCRSRGLEPDPLKCEPDWDEFENWLRENGKAPIYIYAPLQGACFHGELWPLYNLRPEDEEKIRIVLKRLEELWNEYLDEQELDRAIDKELPEFEKLFGG